MTADPGSSGDADGAPELDAEDAKLVTLARSARTRVVGTAGEGAEGAAVRDGTGRTYSAGTVQLPSLSLSALQAAVAAAVSSGATALEAAAVVTDADEPSDADLSVVRDLGGVGTPVHLAALDGSVTGTH